MKRELELAAVSFLILTAVLAAWLSISGPPNLKEWQTLIASVIALVGGTLAYRGAMAKVGLDRELHDRQVSRETTAVMLRLAFATEMFEREVETAVGWMTPLGLFQDIHVKAKDLKIEAPPEFAEAWASLELLPRHAMLALLTIRYELRVIDLAYRELAGHEVYQFNRSNEAIIARDVVAFRNRCTTLVPACGALRQRLYEDLNWSQPVS